MNPFKNTNPAIRDITASIGACRNDIEITTPYKGCWRVTINKKPAADWSDKQSAVAHATRLGWRGNDRPSAVPASLVNESQRQRENIRMAGNEAVLLGVGPRVNFG